MNISLEKIVNMTTKVLECLLQLDPHQQQLLMMHRKHCICLLKLDISELYNHPLNSTLASKTIQVESEENTQTNVPNTVATIHSKTKGTNRSSAKNNSSTSSSLIFHSYEPIKKKRIRRKNVSNESIITVSYTTVN